MAKMGKMQTKKHGSMGNRPLINEDGLVQAVYKSVDEYVLYEGTPKERITWRWVFESQGLTGPWTWTLLTGLRFQPPDEKGQLNAFTEVTTRLGIVHLDDIAKGDVPDHDLESAVGLAVVFKPGRKDDGFWYIDLPTLALEDVT
jgi:hypothetical protein